jgi:hypothetical protein
MKKNGNILSGIEARVIEMDAVREKQRQIFY